MRPEDINEDNWIQVLTEYIEGLDRLEKQPKGPLTVSIRETLSQQQQAALRKLRDSLPCYRPGEA